MNDFILKYLKSIYIVGFVITMILPAIATMVAGNTVSGVLLLLVLFYTALFIFSNKSK